MQEHGQAVDPNLMVLADAYDTAMAKLGGKAPDAWTDAPVKAEAASDSDDEKQNHSRQRGDQLSSSGASSSGVDGFRTGNAAVMALYMKVI